MFSASALVTAWLALVAALATSVRALFWVASWALTVWELLRYPVTCVVVPCNAISVSELPP